MKTEVIGTKELGFKGILKIECNENRLTYISNILSLDKETVLKFIDSMSIGEVVKVSSTGFEDNEVSCENFTTSLKKNYVASDVTFVANKFRLNGKIIDKIIFSITGLENLLRKTGDIIMNTSLCVDKYLINAWINKLSCVDDDSITIHFIVKEKENGKEVFKGEADINTVFSLIDEIIK